MITYDEAVRALRRGIVYSVFITRDNRKRRIYATRNNQIISTILGARSITPDERIEQFDRLNNFVTVFDLQKKDFRRINLATIVDNQFRIYNDKVPPLAENDSAFPKPVYKVLAENPILNKRLAATESYDF